MTVDRRQFLKGGAVVGAAAVGARVAFGPEVGYDPDPSLPVDKVVRTTCSPNCTGSCGQLAFVRDGKIVKIQQAADYPDPVYSPRGCMKGLSFFQNIYGADRIQKPLIRTGERGSGEFREASWDEVLDHIAAELTKVGDKHGWDSIHVFGQVPGSGYVHKGANYRACSLLGMTHGTSFCFNGDLPMGMPITFGVQNAEHEAKDWANARFLLIVGANPLETRIPDVHFIFDAAERGARLVVVDPVYSATASKADSWLQIKPGTDAAFALGMTHVILKENLHDEAFLRTYTDAPLLVRTDNGKRLLESDVLASGKARRYLVWDRRTNAPVSVGTEKLGLPAHVDAALDGKFEVRLKDGRTVTASPGFAFVQAEVKKWTPERAQSVSGVPAEMIEKVARAYATESPAAILMGAGANHWYHGDLTGRAYALLAVVTGNIGRSGSGFSVYVGQYKVRVKPAEWFNPGGEKAKIVATSYFVHGKTETMHPSVPYPKNGFKALFCTFSNFLVQSPDLNKVYERIDALDLFVVVDPQMTDTARYADVVLPATTWYEKKDLTATPLHPFLQLQQPAIEPVGESKSELWIWRELVRRIAPDKAKKYFEVDEDDAIRMILAGGGPAEGITLEQLEKGPVRLNVPDPEVAFQDQIENLTPFPPPSLPTPIEKTQEFVPTGRIELYKDEDRFQEFGETVVTYKPPFDDEVHDPKEYPITLLSPHSKWRIHSSYANTPWLIEIHGGKPKVLLNPKDAAERGIGEGDEIEVFNTRGRLQAWAHVSESARRGSATLPEGWWYRFFKSGKGVNELTSSAINPIHEIHYVPNMWAPSTGWKDCRCEVRRVN
ncbi:MAG: molybdopterin-dependent oxidoreductase [Actinomycetota bacterium]